MPHATGSSGVQRVGQIPNPLALAHYLATSPLFAQEAVFVLMEQESDIELCMLALSVFKPNAKMMHWNESMYQLLDLTRLHRRNQRFIFCSTEQLSTGGLPAPTMLSKESVLLSVNDKLHLSTLKHWLAQNGFEHDTTANLTGRWATRGDVVDVYTTEPLRIQWNGDVIEAIHSFDLETGKTTDSHESITLPPLALTGRSHLTDYLPPTTSTVLYHTQQPSKISFPGAVISIEPFLVSASAASAENAGYIETKSYHLRFDEIIKDMAERHNYIFTQSPQKAEALTPSPSASNTIIIPMEYGIFYHGFVHAEKQIMALTDRSIGFVEQTTKKQSGQLTQAMILALKPGDFVVHLYHGIARFNGTEVMHVNGLDREYFVLEYADNDKIYLPVELAERIDKYIGDANPKLHRLSDASWHEVVQRVKEESLRMAHELLQLYARRSTSSAPELKPFTEEHQLETDCPFTLTGDQTTALQEVFADMSKDKPMDRLLCGDVGFGKKEVAMRAAFRAVLNGYQVAVLAPTTILAQQHLDTFTERLSTYGVQVRALNRLRSTAEQKKVITQMKDGSVDIIIGTHRLYSRDVGFKRLGLIIIDEEQRFGVASKEALLKLRKNAHVLNMTATPIPRTLHLSLSGLRNISTILTPPKERKPVETVIEPLSETAVRKAITQEMARGGQTYYIYNRVETIDKRKTALAEIVPNARIGIVHGQMPPKEIASVMHAFDVGEIDVLLATTIVENGLDIPRANTMIVENASHFGLSELYQLKGRVGRSREQGFAYFFYTEQMPDGDAKKRFIALQEADQLGAGFELAMKDMEIRGVGNILGKEQHGQAIKIGLNLYVRLLNQSIRELEGVPEEVVRDIPIDLPLQARIPENLVPDPEERIVMYQRFANARDIIELQDKRRECEHTDAFMRSGQLDDNIAGLLDLLEIKLLAGRSTLMSIDTMYPTTHNNLDSPRITLTSQQPFTPIPQPWEDVWVKNLNTYKIRATVNELGEDWRQHIKKIISHQKPQTESGAA